MIKKQEGQSLVEFALIFGTMLLITLVFISLSLAVYYQIQLSRINADIARIASLAEFESFGDNAQKIELILGHYQNNLPIPMVLLDDTMFQYNIQVTAYSQELQMMSVQSSYRGVMIPLLGRVPVAVSLAYPRLLSGAVP
jgi:hypothetical protein